MHPLTFKNFKPRSRGLKEGDMYKTKPQLAEGNHSRELESLWIWLLNLYSIDSLYGEAGKRDFLL